jgi:hypothetical protein
MFQLFFALVNIAMAWWHSKLIKENRPIKHGLWAAGYFALVLIAFWITYDWFLLFLLLLERKLVFDAALNYFRDKPLFYVSATTTSIIDRYQRKVFGLDGHTPALILVALIILLNIINFYL